MAPQVAAATTTPATATPTVVLFFECPWCSGMFEVAESEVNCGIFRHGINRTTGRQLDPHLTLAAYEDLSLSGNIYGGCGRPIRVTRRRRRCLSNLSESVSPITTTEAAAVAVQVMEWVAEKCDYDTMYASAAAAVVRN